MHPTMINFGRGFPIPQGKEIQIGAPWVPVTPEKPAAAATRSSPMIPAAERERQGSQLARSNWQELAEYPAAGYAPDEPNCNGAVQNFDPVRALALNGGNCSSEVAFAEKNRMINHIAGSYAQAFINNGPGFNGIRLTDLLLAATGATPDEGIHQTERPRVPNPYSQQNCNWSVPDPVSLLLEDQNHISGSNLWNNTGGIQQRGFPIPYQPSYDLNTPQKTETDAASSVTNSFKFAPVTPEQARKLENKQLSEVLNFSAEISIQEKDNRDNLVSSIQNESIEHHCDELLQNIVDSSSAAIPAPFREDNISERGSDQGIDLNKTPEQKTPKRRKHRPKVIIEGKPKRTPKSATPKKPNLKENPSGKRKYVRRKGLKSSTTQLAEVNNEITDPPVRSAAKTCRRVLNFDMEKMGDDIQAKTGQHDELQNSNNWAFDLNTVTQATQSCIRTSSISGTKSAELLGHQNGLMVKTQQAEISYNLTHPENQMPTHYMSQPERPPPKAPQTMMRDLQMKNSNAMRTANSGNVEPWQDSFRNGFTSIHHHINAEGIGQIVFQAQTNLENLQRTGQAPLQSIPQPGPNNLADRSQRRGSKREYCHTIEQTHPHAVNLMGSSLLCQEIFQVDKYNSNSCHIGRDFSETPKKKRLGSGLDTDRSSMNPCIAADVSSKQVTINYGNDVNQNHFPAQMKHGKLMPFLESNNAPKNPSNGINESISDWYIRSMAAQCHFQRQPISSELPSRAGKTGDSISNGSIQFNPSRTAEKCNLLPVTPPKNAPASSYSQGTDICHFNRSAKKQTTVSTLSNSVTSSSDKGLLLRKNSCNYNQQSPIKTTGSPEIQKYRVPIDEIICRLKALDLNSRNNDTVGEEQNALVPYKRDDQIVPYGGHDHIKKRRPRPKVDLDAETTRLWKLLMEKEGSEDPEGTDKEKEKYWEEERKVFRGRAESFIARMHLVQGDRRFSQWKGSVVDSVIGVFLTQNVSDHLSSSAFMSLAARFPPQSTSNNRTCYKGETRILVEEPEDSVPGTNDTIKWNAKASGQTIYNQSSTTPHESSRFNGDCVTSGRRANLVEAKNQRVEEEVLSSQDSFDSSLIRAAGGIRSSSGSNSEAEDSTTACKPSGIQGSTSINLQQISKTAMFKEFHCHENASSFFYDSSMHVHTQLEDVEHGSQKIALEGVDNPKNSSALTYTTTTTDPPMQAPIHLSSNYQLHRTPDAGIQEVDCLDLWGEESISSWASNTSRTSKAKDDNSTIKKHGQMAENMGKMMVQHDGLFRPQGTPLVGPYALSSKHQINQYGSHVKNNQCPCNNDQHERMKALESSSVTGPVNLTEANARRQNNTMQQVSNVPKLAQEASDIDKRVSLQEKQTQLEKYMAEPTLKQQVHFSNKAYSAANTNSSKGKRGKIEGEKKKSRDWESLRKHVQSTSTKRERTQATMDSLDYEALRNASVRDISDAIKERGMNNMLAERIKAFLNRLVKEHGSIDLEWLRDAPPDQAKDYLLSIRGLGLKSVECVRLLTLHHLAFPVDTNVGRIAVRLGWVPLQPLPESLQLHLLELYPVLESIQKYLWPRLCKLDQRTLYELHYQMITFGKVFCTKSRPNCNACPMRGECRHFASAFTSARLALPAPEEKSLVSAPVPIAANRKPSIVVNPMPLPSPEKDQIGVTRSETANCEPIIEVPATPEPESREITETEIEEAFYEDPEEIPTIKLNIEEFTTNLQTYIQENKMGLQEGDMSKALVVLNSAAASIPTPKLKNVSRLRTEHQVYELPDSHPLLNRMDRREPDDPSPYLLAIWTPGETANSIQPPERRCGWQESGKLCNENTCFSCNSIREENSQTVRGTLLIPCRTAMRGSFPLNGTYFQVNEVFADHDSSLNPIDVPRAWIWNLPRRAVYFGTSVSTIFKGLTTEGIQYCFWRGFVCVRGFDQKTRAPRPLMARLHFPASKLAKTKNEKRKKKG
ncbi:transcriptional activator DEMETER-like [Malania oleifera]|uniref:transcriptional activator DEMETER-like n=1 Tax=Malania oleifera TaxID=397392 RepID=UPI0025ADB614|nr:transcriptional activator DEMETER-like [Malania oleifera]XP_057979532.1 transcriptional activator DEMETER-like [Malania oleifera]